MTLSNLRLILSPTLRLSPVCLQIIVEERDTLFPVRASLEATLLSADPQTPPPPQVSSSSPSREGLSLSPSSAGVVRSTEAAAAAARQSPGFRSDSSLAHRPARGESLRASVSEPKQLPFTPSHHLQHHVGSPAVAPLEQQTEVLDAEPRPLSPPQHHQQYYFPPPPHTQTSETRERQWQPQPLVQTEATDVRSLPTPPPPPPPPSPRQNEIVMMEEERRLSSPFEQTNASTSTTSLCVDVPRGASDDRLTPPVSASPRSPTPIADRFSSSSGGSTPKLQPPSPNPSEPQPLPKPYVPSRNLDFKPLFAGAPVSPEFIRRKGSANSVESQKGRPLRSASGDTDKDSSLATPTTPALDSPRLPAKKEPSAIATAAVSEGRVRSPSPPLPPPPVERPSSRSSARSSSTSGKDGDDHSHSVIKEEDDEDGESVEQKKKDRNWKRSRVQTLAPVVPMVELDFDSGLLSMDERIKFFGG
jgi:hypothetical protein